MGQKTFDRSFAGGEISPEMYARLDLTVNQTGLAKCRNFITLPHGPAQNRAGTEFVNETKDSSKKSRLIPFAYSTTQTMVLEFGAGYIRFHTNAGTVLTGGGVPYEIATTYAEEDLFDIHYVQSADVMTLTHPSYPVRELRRLGALNWVIIDVVFNITQAGLGSSFTVEANDEDAPSPLVAPAFVTATGATTGGFVRQVAYYVQGIQDYEMVNNFRSVSATLDSGAPITVEWGAVGGAVGYRVYREYDGIGPARLIAETTQLSFVDDRTAGNLIESDFSPANAQTHHYVVTTVGASGEESLPSTSKSAYQDLTYPGNSIKIVPTTSSVTYESYRVYKNSDGTSVFGYIGTAKNGETFSDNNIEPDFTKQPPVAANPFGSANNYPRAVSYYQQRRLFAGTLNQPQNLWGTRTGTESNFSTNVVVRDDDAISFRISALKVSTIRHIVPLGDVILLSNSGEWRLNSTDGGGLTPSTISVKPQSYVGASNVTPQVTDSSILYAQARGGHIREIVYTLADNGAVGYGNTDLSLLAHHLFNFKTIVDMAFAKAPFPILWCVSSDGRLLGMTYVPDQKVAGWHQHDTDGVFESCCVVSEGEEDMLYVVVKRQINSVQRRYIERLHTRQFQQLQDGFFVDCGATYTGSAVTTISGLGYLEGKTVSVLGDGAVFPQQVVASGKITLDRAVTKAHVGLPITADLVTLPISSDQVMASGQGRSKNINKVYIMVDKTSGLRAGPDANNLREFKQRTTEAFDSPPSMMESKEAELPLTPQWNSRGQVMIRQTDPLPVTVLGMTLDVTLGG